MEMSNPTTCTFMLVIWPVCNVCPITALLRMNKYLQNCYDEFLSPLEISR